MCLSRFRIQPWQRRRHRLGQLQRVDLHGEWFRRHRLTQDTFCAVYQQYTGTTIIIARVATAPRSTGTVTGGVLRPARRGGTVHQFRPVLFGDHLIAVPDRWWRAA